MTAQRGLGEKHPAWRGSWCRCSVLMLAVLLAGCAVARIDVDVYKGPLADHEHVQIEQFAALAIGAKPLLVSLRDRLQWPNDSIRQCMRSHRTWYQPGYILRPDEANCRAKDGSRVRNEKKTWQEAAARVNGVLYLYEDAGQEDLEPFIEEGRLAIEAYDRAIVFFHDQENTRIWEEASAEEAFLPVTVNDLQTMLSVSVRRGANLDRLKQSRELLRLAYKKYLGVPLSDQDLNDLTTWESLWRPATDGAFEKLWRSAAVNVAYSIFVSELASVAAGDSTSQANLAALKAARPGGEQSDKELQQDHSNLIFESLARSEVVAQHGRALFGDNRNSAAAKAFTKRIVIIATAFGDARVQLRKLWNNALATLEFVNESDKLMESDKWKLRKAYAELIAFLTQPWHLTQVMYARAREDNDIDELRAWLEKREPEIWKEAKEFAKPNQEPRVRFPYREADASLAKVLYDPNQIEIAIKALEKADARFRAYGEVSFPGSSKLKELKQRTYGLVRGPTFRAAELTTFQARWQDVQAAASASGLERGRLPDGLETLIERYLLASAKLGGSRRDDDIAEKRDRLLEALVRFSKKVLFIADHELLLEVRPREGLSAELKGQLEQDQARYIRILQATGNSIRIQADELRHRRTHGEGLAAREPGERRAMAAALLRSNERALDFFRTRLSASVQSAEAAVESAEAAKEEAEKRVERVKALLAAAGVTDSGATAQLQMEPKRSGAEIDAELSALAPRWSAVALLEGSGSATSNDPTLLQGAVVNAASDDGMIDGATARTSLVAALDTEIADYPPALKDEPRLQLLKQARTYFAVEGVATLDQIAAGSATQVYDALRGKVLGKKPEIERRLKELLTDAKRLLQKAMNQQTKATGAREEAQANLKTLQARREEILKRAEKDGAGGDYGKFRGAIFAVFEQAVAAARQANPNGEDQNKITKAKQAVAKLALPQQPSAADLALDTPRKHSKEVLDDMIAALRHELLVATKEFGKESEPARFTAEALSIAYEHRAGMAYIRPPGAYLRSSFLATNLQDSPRLGWENMLTEHGLRTTPLIGWIYNDAVTDREKAKINAEIDKQFWQTINSVRVAGAGNTNYVMAKDDIGNWYVKKYAADAAPIIKSAKNLALFGLSGQFDSNLLKQVRQDDGTVGQGADAVDKKPTSAMGRLLEKHEKAYGKAVETDFAALQKLVNDAPTSTLVTTIKSAWSGNADIKQGARLTELSAELDAAAQETLPAANTKLDSLPAKPSTADRTERLYAALDEVAGLYPALRSKVDTIAFVDKASGELEERQNARATAERKLTEEKAASSPDDVIAMAEKTLSEATEAEKKAASDLESAKRAQQAALREAARVLRRHLQDFLGRREKAIQEYETAVVFIGDANNPSQSDSSKAAKTQ